MAHRANDEQIGPEMDRKIDDIPYRMTFDGMGVNLYLLFVRHCARALNKFFDTTGDIPRRLPGFVRSPWRIGRFFNAHHMELGLVLPGDCKRYRQSTQCGLGAVVRMQDFAEHRTSDLSLILLHDENRTFGELHHAIRLASNHTLVKGRMTTRPNYEQVRLQVGCERDDVPHRMPRDDVSI